MRARSVVDTAALCWRSVWVCLGGFYGVADLSEVWWSLRFANHGLIALGIPIPSGRG
jgi:hypothetical protein